MLGQRISDGSARGIMTLRRVGDRLVVHACERCEPMRLQTLRTGDLASGHAVRGQGVGDQRTVAAPRHGLGAHERDAVGPRQLEEAPEFGIEVRRLHVVGVAAEREVAPAGVR
jgi:hypothetical protein